MKKWLALISAAMLVVSLTACGGKTPVKDPASASETETAAETVTEMTTEDPTKPEVGRVSEKGAFYVYIPENWCKSEIKGDETQIKLYDIPSAPDIKDDTPEVEILVKAEAAEKDAVKKAVDRLLKNEGAKEGKATKLGGADFSVVTYKNKKEKRDYTVYVGLGGGSLTTVTLKGISAADEDVAAILKSISFKK
ncbi:MAG: hypothetical protein IJT44_02170 [Clostridia bacterium]|nr:hypothetical protein [Clostridia bacterium]